MANCSDFNLSLSGHPFKLKQARDELIKHQHDFSIREVYDEQFTHEPPTWNLQGEDRWGVNLDTLVNFLEPYELSGVITDAEPGSGFFCKIAMENGIVLENINTGFMSDEHYKHCSDNSFWYEQLAYAVEEPDIYPDAIEFLLKHNIITQEYLNGIAH